MEKAVRIAGGFTLLGAGTVMLVLPGPGVLAILGGLALLEKDIPWARRITDSLKTKAGKGPAGRDQAAGG